MAQEVKYNANKYMAAELNSLTHIASGRFNPQGKKPFETEWLMNIQHS